jgi:hypothetical protein
MKHDAAEGSKRASQFAEHPYPSYRRGRPTQHSANTGKRRRGELQVEASQPLISRLVTNPNGSERLKRLWCFRSIAARWLDDLARVPHTRLDLAFPGATEFEHVAAFSLSTHFEINELFILEAAASMRRSDENEQSFPTLS